MSNNPNYLKGGEFLTRDVEDIFIPEELSEEQKMISGTCDDFLKKEIFPLLDEIDANKAGMMRELLNKSGEMGLLGISLPEEYMGFGQSFTTSMLTSDRFGAGFSFAVAYSAHTGIGSLPILYYGTEEQKQKYLPKLATGEMAGAYCLTEPNAGSDANSGKTKAVLSANGKHYTLNGQKMWITNGGFADVFTVFAKIDDDRILSAFIVERNFPGISFGAEEKKMGIKGSSTVQIFFNDCQVPVENLLGKRGEGFRIALNILHIGRIKLGANVLGACRNTINYSVNYANERKQFGSLISSFGAIQYKLANQVIKAFTIESAVYRTSKYIDETIENSIATGKDKSQAYLEAIGEYAMEAAILKVFGSEVLDYIVDEAVQIYGGMGFSAEMPVDRCYRDSRINRIFEGTNEINRMVCTDMLLKFAKRADSKIFVESKAIFDAIGNISNKAIEKDDFFEYFNEVIKNFKKITLLLMYRAYETLGKQFNTEQEIMMHIADMLIQTYAAESVVLRVKKLMDMHADDKKILYKDIVDVFLYEAASQIRKSAADTIFSFASDAEFSQLQHAVETLSSLKPVNIKVARRNIAKKLIEENKYCF